MDEIFDRAVHLFPMSEEFWLEYSEVAAEPADILAKVTISYSSDRSDISHSSDSSDIV